ncbi:MAG: hypothetical protein D6799_01730 [Bacteroidetes bacterium]|nr:MAG: hypothetical protein D6799_01730 [Bacteroidota bacterium]
MFRYLIMLILLVWFLKDVISQNAFTSVSLYSGYGAVIQHTAKIGNLIQERPFFFEINIFKQSSGYYKWHHINNFPDYGLCLNYETLGNAEKLGSSIALAPFLEFPFHKKEKRVLFKMKMAWGLAYATKRFDVENNHKNIAIGTHWNTFIQFRFLWQIKLSSKFYLNPNLTFIHISNCRFSVPNLGINTLYPSVGMVYHFKENKKYEAPQDSASDKKHKHEILIFSAMGVNEIEPPTGNKFWAFSTGINYYYNLHQNQQIGVGTDAFYEESLAMESGKSDTDKVNITFNNAFSSGLKICYAYNFGRITPILEMGIYVYKPDGQLPNGIFYHRLGCRYYFKNNIVAHFSLKTHFGVAYHIEAGIGYRFGWKKHL